MQFLETVWSSNEGNEGWELHLPHRLDCNSLLPWPSAQHPAGLWLCQCTEIEQDIGGKGSLFYLESAVEAAVELFHLMNKAGIVPTLQQELGKDLINQKIWQENSDQGIYKGSQGSFIHHLHSLKFVFPQNQSFWYF